MRRISRYIHQLGDWPNFHWDQDALSSLLANVHIKRGRLIGEMKSLGFSDRDETMLAALTDEVVKSSEIEGEIFNPRQVRSSIARRLGMEIAGLLPSDRRVDGVVQMTLDATQNLDKPLTKERLCGWHEALFPSPPHGIRVGSWRSDDNGPMLVVSGAVGHERIHYEAPPAERMEREMAGFIEWMNLSGGIDPVLRAAKAHLWFVTIHPFDDGNGRIARAIADWALARTENSAQRYYSMSAQIRRVRKVYYDILEQTQKGTLDITGWMRWFLECLARSVEAAESTLVSVMQKDRFWKSCSRLPLNERHRMMLNKLLDGTFEGKLTSSKWAKTTKCSQDTAHRDIIELVDNGLLALNPAGGRSTSYFLKPQDFSRG